MSSHGPQFDDFNAQATHGHGGAEYDEGYRHTTATDLLVERFPQKKSLDAHGPHWDEFGWTDMPIRHGNQFDTDFRQPAALDDGHDHGTWFDVFRGGTQVRYIAGGCDYEGTVVNAGNDHLLVKPRHGGRDTEIGLGQIRQWRTATESGQPSKQRTPRTATQVNLPNVVGDDGLPGTQGESPSAHDPAARGGERTALDASSVEGRTTNKTASDLDVAKATACQACGNRPATHQSASGDLHCKVCQTAALSHGYDHVGEPHETRAQHIAAGLHETRLGKSTGRLDVAKTIAELRALVAKG